MPSSPAPSNCSNHRSATSRSVVHGLRCTSGLRLQLRGQPGPPVDQRDLPQILVARGEEVEGQEVGGRLGGQPVHPRRRRVDALLEGVEVQPGRTRHDELAVHDAALGQGGLQRRRELGEVAGEGALVPAPQLHLVAVAEHDAPEAVPLGLEQPSLPDREVGGRLGQHRSERRHDRQSHGRSLPHTTRVGNRTGRAGVQVPDRRVQGAPRKGSSDAYVDHPGGHRGRRGGDGGRLHGRHPRPWNPAGARRRPRPCRPPRARRSRVDATGTVRVKPDTATVNLGVQAERPTAQEAMAAAGTAAQGVIDALKAAGISEDDITTTDLSLWPRTDDDGKAIVGYTATNSVNATIRAIDKAGADHRCRDQGRRRRRPGERDLVLGVRSHRSRRRGEGPGGGAGQGAGRGAGQGGRREGRAGRADRDGVLRRAGAHELGRRRRGDAMPPFPSSRAPRTSRPG